MIPKFRAWDKNNAYMEYTEKNLTVVFARDGIQVVDHTTFSSSCTNMEDYVLMQSTGLFDKNGKLIYESDIVHIKSSDGIDYKALIIFKDGGFCAIDGTERNYSVLRRRLTDSKLFLEILGNIYEHPHLLEEE